MSKWRDLICCIKPEKHEPKHHREETKLTLEQVMKDKLIQKYLDNTREKRIVHYVRPRTTPLPAANQQNGMSR